MLQNQLKTIVLLGGLTAVFLAIGGLAAPNLIWVFGGIAVVVNLLMYFFSDRVVLKMNRAREASRTEHASLYKMVEELSAVADMPAPRVYIVNDPSPNAFATGRNPKNGVVAVTTGIQQLLSERELRGVIAHELAHIKNRDILIATIGAMMVSGITMVASVVRWGAIMGGNRGSRQGSNPLVLLLLSIVAPIAATIIQLAISRSREYGADATGAKISRDPMALAAALAKLERGSQKVPMVSAAQNPATASLYICSPLSGRSIRRWFSTHPPIPERIRRLEAMSGDALASARAL